MAMLCCCERSEQPVFPCRFEICHGHVSRKHWYCECVTPSSCNYYLVPISVLVSLTLWHPNSHISAGKLQIRTSYLCYLIEILRKQGDTWSQFICSTMMLTPGLMYVLAIFCSNCRVAGSFFTFGLPFMQCALSCIVLTVEWDIGDGNPPSSCTHASANVNKLWDFILHSACRHP